MTVKKKKKMCAPVFTLQHQFTQPKESVTKLHLVFMVFVFSPHPITIFPINVLCELRVKPGTKPCNTSRPVYLLL